MVATARWNALGTWCEVLTLDDQDLAAVAEVARAQVADLDASCSRFRADSELSGLAHGRPQRVTRLLAGAVAYSRVHTGVHYPGDVVIGSIVGAGTAAMVTAACDRVADDRYVRRALG